MRRVLRLICILLSLLVAVGGGQKTHAAVSGSSAPVFVAQAETIPVTCDGRASESPGVSGCCFGLCAAPATVLPSQSPILRISGPRLTPSRPRQLTGLSRAPDPFPPKVFA
jgi:hypothetical protein